MSGARILIATAHPPTAQHVQACLSRLGYTVAAVTASGQASLEQAAAARPDLALVDVALPGLHQLTAAGWDFPVVYLSPYEDETALQRIPTSQPYGYVAVPFAERELRLTIEMALQAHALRKALADSEARYRAIVQDQTELICRFSPDKRITFANEAYGQYFGLAGQDLVGRDFLEFVLDEDRPGLEACIASLSPSSPLLYHENRTRLPNGELRWTQWSNRAIFDQAGQLLEFQSVGRDITAYKQTEEALKNSEERYRTVSEMTSDFAYVFSVEPDGALVPEWVSGAFSRITGYTLEDIQAPNGWTAIIHPDDLPDVIEAALLVLAGQAVERQYRIVAKNGQVHWLRVYSRPVLGGGQEPRVTRVYGAVQDITERQLAEEQLAETRGLLMAAINSTPAGVLIADAPDARIRYANAAALEIRGKTDQPLNGVAPESYTQHWQAFHPDGAPLAPEELPLSQAILHGKTVKNVEFIIRRQDGQERWVLANAAPVYNARGDIVAGVVVFPDVTELKQAEQAVRRQLKELGVLHAVTLATAEVADEDGLIERATQLVGETLYPDDFGVLLLDEAAGSLLPHPSYRSSQPWTLRPIPLGHGITGRVAAEGRPWRVPDVSREPAYISIGPIRRSEVCVPLRIGERVIGVLNAESAQVNAFSEADERLLSTLAGQLGTAIEKVRLFQAEQQRRREAETLREITTALVASLELDQVLNNLLIQLERVVPYDSACVLLLEGDSVHAVAGRGLPDLSQVRGQAFPTDNALLQEILGTGCPVILADAQADERFEGWGGTDYVHGWMGVPLTVRGRTIGHLTLDSRRPGAYGPPEAGLAQAFANQAAVAIENARLYAAEQQRARQLAAALARQEELDRLKNDFIQNASHELRTPLSILLGHAELLASGELGALQPDQRRAAGIVARRGRMLKKLIEDLTAILAAETGSLESEALDLAELVHTSLADFEPNARKAGVRLSADVEPGLPPMLGDPHSLRRVLDNLLDNALKFTPAGGAVSIRLARQDQQLIVEVSDTGIGIPPDKLERIFERFYQVDGSMSRRHGGVGLGLALVKEIVQAHGGQVSAHSAPGQGATLRVCLPAPDA